MNLHVKAHPEAITNLAMLPDGKRLFSDSFKNTIVKVWDLQTGKDILTLPGHAGGVGSQASRRLFANSSSEAAALPCK